MLRILLGLLSKFLLLRFVVKILKIRKKLLIVNYVKIMLIVLKMNLMKKVNLWKME